MRHRYTCNVMVQHTFYTHSALDEQDIEEMERILQEDPTNRDGVLECIPLGTLDEVLGLETWYGDPEIVAEV